MKEGFKSTPIGDIPFEWHVVKLEDLTEKVTKGTTPTTLGFKYEYSGINFIKVESITGNGKFIPTLFAYISEECHNSLQRSQLEEDDILFSIAGALGRVAIVTREVLPANTNQALALIRLKDKSYRDYLFHFLKSEQINDVINKINVSTAQANLSLSNINNFHLPIPPKEERRKIAEILSTVDEKIDLIEAQIAQTTELKKGLMQHLLTKGIGHTTFKDSPLGEIPESWQFVKVNDLLKLLTDFEANGSFADVKANVTVKETKDYAWYVRATDLENKSDLSEVKYVDEKSYKFLRKTSLEGGELLITKRGEIGKVYFFNMPENMAATLAPNLYLLKLNEHVLPKFLYYHFLSEKGNASLKRINASTTLGALYKDDVKKLQVPLPDLNEQQKIVDVLTTVDQKIEILCTKKSFFIDLKKGLMQQLLTGKVRVNQTNRKHDATKSQHVQAAVASV